MRYLILFTSLLFATEAFAYVVPTYRDLKPATQMMVERQVLTTPIAAAATRLKSANASSSSTTTTITSFSAQPDVARNITATTGGTTTDCAAGNVVVTGTNFFGKTITENLAITADQNGATTGNKAFKTVTSVLIPIQDGNGCTYSIGVGSKLGLKACMDSAAYYVSAGLGGAFEATRATVAASASAVESNTATLSGSLDGTKDVLLFFMQNFACHP